MTVVQSLKRRAKWFTSSHLTKRTAMRFRHLVLVSRVSRVNSRKHLITTTTNMDSLLTQFQWTLASNQTTTSKVRVSLSLEPNYTCCSWSLQIGLSRRHRESTNIHLQRQEKMASRLSKMRLSKKVYRIARSNNYHSNWKPRLASN